MFLFFRVDLCSLLCTRFQFSCINFICACDGLDLLLIFYAAHIPPRYHAELLTFSLPPIFTDASLIYPLSPPVFLSPHSIQATSSFSTQAGSLKPSFTPLPPSLPPLPRSLCIIQLSRILHLPPSPVSLPGHLPPLHLELQHAHEPSTIRHI